MFNTVAVNPSVCPWYSVPPLVGATDTDTGGLSVIAADADLVGSATLVAVTVTIWLLATDAGAV